MRIALGSCGLLLFPLLISLALFPLFSADDVFDVRRHLSTVTRYDVAKGTNNVVSSTIPDGCHVIHLNLVSRHGTRSPTKKRIKELDKLASRLETLVNEAKQTTDGKPNFQNIPSWILGWQSPWKGREKGGELISLGEEELYRLALRVRERFPEIFYEEYHPDTYPIRATQVPRASASAVSFGLGLFSGKGALAAGKHRAFSVISESRASDICLRFFDTCETYKEYREKQEPEVEKLKEPILEEITSALISRYHLNFKKQDIASLWFLCKQEASLLDTTDQACSLFNQTEINLLEWTDDLEGFLLKGYGNSINYRMGVPLLRDIFQTMEQAIVAKEENRPFEKARLRFAHAETLVPFSCLLGLFLEGSDFEKIQREEPLSLPPKPPQERNWRGSVVAPFSANDMLALYQCTSNGAHNSSYFVQVLHNEIPVPMPGCGNTDFCPFEVFKERIVEPHLMHEFHRICAIKREVPDPIVETAKPCSLTCRLLNSLAKFFSPRGSTTQPDTERTEL